MPCRWLYFPRTSKCLTCHMTNIQQPERAPISQAGSPMNRLIDLHIHARSIGLRS
jgi:hypothetical protein